MAAVRRSVLFGAGGALFFIADVLVVRLAPSLVVDRLGADAGFLLSIPVAWICAWLCRLLADRSSEDVVAGVALLVLVAALLHATALHWAPALYGDDHAGRCAAAWLLWIYGLILGFALLAACRTARLGFGRRTLELSRHR